jgi:hypothetical protein
LDANTAWCRDRCVTTLRTVWLLKPEDFRQLVLLQHKAHFGDDGAVMVKPPNNSVYRTETRY